MSSRQALCSCGGCAGAGGSPRCDRGEAEGIWVLPKGLVDAGERPRDRIARGIRGDGRPRAPRLEDRRRPLRLHVGGSRSRVQDRELLPRLRGGGRIGELPAGMEIEIAEARWLPLAEAPRLLAYQGERDTAARARSLEAGGGTTLYDSPGRRADFALNFYNPAVGEQLRTAGRRRRSGSATSRAKYRKGMIVTVLCGARYGLRERVFDAVIDKVEVKPLKSSPRGRSSTTTRRSARRGVRAGSSASSTTAR